MAGYLGNVPVPQATQTRDRFVATAGQTSFATSGYDVGFLDVYLNGVKLDSTDYTATNGSDVVLTTGAASGDIVEVIAFSTFEVLNQTFSGNTAVTGDFDVTGAMTGSSLTLSGGVYLGGTGSANHLDDYEDGTFTPTLSGGLNATSGSAKGSYLKIGNVVHIDINIYKPLDLSSTTPIEIGNLPFTKENNGLISHLNIALRYANVTGYQLAGFAIGGGTTSGRIRVFPEGSGTYGNLEHSAFTSSYSAVQISGSYICY